MEELIKTLQKLNESVDRLNTLLETKQRKRESPKRDKFRKPTIPEIRQYVEETGASVNAAAFYNFYESKGWKVGKTEMRCWKAAIRTWNQKGKENGILS